MSGGGKKAFSKAESLKAAPVLSSESETHELGHISQTLLTELTQTQAEAKHRAGEGGVAMLAPKASVAVIKRGNERSAVTRKKTKQKHKHQSLFCFKKYTT